MIAVILILSLANIYQAVIHSDFKRDCFNHANVSIVSKDSHKCSLDPNEPDFMSHLDRDVFVVSPAFKF